MQVSRRRALLLGAGAVSAPISGCSVLSGSQDHEITLRFANYTGRENTVRLRLIDPDADDYGDALASAHEVTVPVAAEGETAGTVLESTTVPRQRYVVRTLLKYGNRKRDHYHFVPGENSTDRSESKITVGIYEDGATGDYYVTFR